MVGRCLAATRLPITPGYTARRLQAARTAFLVNRSAAGSFYPSLFLSVGNADLTVCTTPAVAKIKLPPWMGFIQRQAGTVQGRGGFPLAPREWQGWRDGEEAGKADPMFARRGVHSPAE